MFRPGDDVFLYKLEARVTVYPGEETNVKRKVEISRGLAIIMPKCVYKRIMCELWEQ